MKANGNLTVDGSAVFTEAVSFPMVYVRDEKSSGTAGGTFTSGAWRTRDLNTVKVNTISGASLSSNQLTLPAGTYHIRARAPAAYVLVHRARLFDVTRAAVLIRGPTEYSPDTLTSVSVTDAWVRGVFTFASQTTIRLEHDAQVTRSGNGFGVQSVNVTSVFSELWVRRIK